MLRRWILIIGLAVFTAVGVQTASAEGVARIILEQAEREKGDSIHITHEQIANHLGTTREVVSREVEQLRCAGIIFTARGRIGILDRARLSILGVMRTSSAKQ